MFSFKCLSLCLIFVIGIVHGASLVDPSALEDEQVEVDPKEMELEAARVRMTTIISNMLRNCG